VICDAPLVATLNLPRITDAMPTITTTTRDDWPPERLDRLARGMFAVLYGRPAPAPAAMQDTHKSPDPLRRSGFGVS
jgi:hypothetical protein